MLPTKKILFPSSFWGIFDFFFCSFLSILKNNKRILRYKGGMRIANIQAVAKGVKTQTQTVTGLMGKRCKCG
jgi:hypothetical protein